MTVVDPALKAKLASMGNKFNQTKADPKINADNAFPDFDDGKYSGLLTGANIGNSKSSDRLQISWEYTFLEGKYQGKQKYNYQGMDDRDDALLYCLREMRKFGIDVSQLEVSEIPEALEAIVRSKPKVTFTLKTKPGKDFQNLYLDTVESALTTGEGAAPDAATPNPAAEEAAANANPTSTSSTTSAPPSDTASATAAGSTPTVGVSTRVNFELNGEKRLGIVTKVEGDVFTVKSKGQEYQMGEEDFTPAA